MQEVKKNSLKSAMLRWFTAKIPARLILAIMHLLAILPVSKKLREEHKQKNDTVWEPYCEAHMIHSAFIEKQTVMDGFCYGRKTNVAYNGCEVIAVYNALRALGHTKESFPQLLHFFEQKGIVLHGLWGTSPRAIRTFFQKKGFETETLVGRQINEESIAKLQKDYATYIVTVINDRDNLREEIHTMCVTCGCMEEGVQSADKCIREARACFLHNAYRYTGAYASLYDCLQEYRGGRARAIYVLGIGKRESIRA